MDKTYTRISDGQVVKAHPSSCDEGEGYTYEKDMFVKWMLKDQFEVEYELTKCGPMAECDASNLLREYFNKKHKYLLARRMSSDAINDGFGSPNDISTACTKIEHDLFLKCELLRDEILDAMTRD